MTDEEFKAQLEQVQRHAAEAGAAADAAKAAATAALDIIADLMLTLALPEPPAEVEPSTINVVAAVPEVTEGDVVATFVVERLGDPVAACSVEFTVGGEVDDADFADLSPMTGRIVWAEGDGEAKRIELMIKQDVVREGDELATLTLSAASNCVLGTAQAGFLLKNDDLPAAGQPCAEPYMGPIRRLASGKKVLLHHARKLSGPYAGLAPIAAQLTACTFIPGGTFPEPSQYDHSDAGIRGFADSVYNLFVRVRGGRDQERVAWIDWEEFNSSKRTSKNVPAGVHYNPNTDSFHAAFYELSIFPGYKTFQVSQAHAEELRKEAARFGGLFFKRILDRALADKLVGFEQFSYAHPDVPGKGSTWDGQAADVAGWFCQSMLGGGTPCYFSGTLAEMSANLKNPAHWTATFAQRVRDQRKAFGPTFKIVPAIWAKWYRNEGGVDNGNNANFPNGDPCVPAGFMSRCFNDILDAGADGAVIFQNSDMSGSSGALAQRYSDRHAELAAIVKARGNFVGIRY